MSIAKRLYMLALFVTFAMVVGAAINIFQINRVYGVLNFISTNTVTSLNQLDKIADSIATIRVKVWQSLLVKDEAQKHNLRLEINQERQRVNVDLDVYEKKFIADAKDLALFRDAKKSIVTYDQFIDHLLATDSTGKNELAVQDIFSHQDIIVNMMNAIWAHREYNIQMGEKSSVEARKIEFESAIITSILNVVSIIVVVSVLLALRHKMIRSMRLAITAAQSVSAGDLTLQINIDGTDEFAQLTRAIKDMATSLESVCTQIRHGTDAILVASGEIAVGNMDLSVRTEQQASALQDTTGSMDKLTSIIKQNSDNARQANTLANTASLVAVEGGAVVSQVVETMAAINDSSRKVVDIISVIDSIAFQTNILALNAAVEAARAGEQGRGFAVVAAEVRNLAQRSASAAKEIKTLIDNSVDKVDSGARLVDQAGIAMNNIVTSIQKVNDVVGEISSASQEQSSGIEELNRAIFQIDESTQKNAALVEEAAAASTSLEQQANRLTSVVSIFKLKSVVRDNVAKVHPQPPVNKVSRGMKSPRPISSAESIQSVPVAKQNVSKNLDVATLPKSKSIDHEEPSAHGNDWDEF
ncbi:methyl-accepting chemotaxis protein [Undibacterium sp. MH2W]|uniref:methyl-accepting chemotaxis protein n=1 Tax=Undibacterium sp. MH2W TaxID=3413044 RepID=UPI003BF048EA